MFEGWVHQVRSAGAFGALSVAGGWVGLLLALLALALLVRKSSAAKVVAFFALLCAMAVLAAGAMGHLVGITAVTRAMEHVPDDQKHLLLRAGTAEARGDLIIALLAWALPFLAGAAAAFLRRSMPGIGLAGLAPGPLHATAAAF